MNYTQDHLDSLDEQVRRPGRNGHPLRLSDSTSGDPALEAAARDVEMLWQATRLERLQEKLEMLKEYEGKSKAKAEAKESKNLTSVWFVKQRRVLSVAAGILLLIAAGWFIFREQGPQEIQHQYLAENFEQYILHDVVKSSTVQLYTPQQLRAYNLFEAQEFRKAIPALQELWTERSDTLALFYLITAHICIGDTQTGEMLLKQHREEFTRDQLILLDTIL